MREELLLKCKNCVNFIDNSEPTTTEADTNWTDKGGSVYLCEQKHIITDDENCEHYFKKK